MNKVNFDDLGIEKDLNKEIKTLQSVVQLWADELLIDLRKKYDKNRSNASGQLRQSFSYDINALNRNKVLIQMLDYYVNVEEGQKPTIVPYQSLFKWIQDKKKWGSFRNITRGLQGFLAKRIQSKIATTGTKAKPFIVPVVTNNRIQLLSDSIAKQLSEQIFKK